MSTMNISEKTTLIKNILKSIRENTNLEELKKQYGEILRQISPLEIALIEQQLVREGVKPEDILKVCDLHVELFREYLESTQLRNVPEGHPLHLLLRENEEIMKLIDAVNLYANTLLNEKDPVGKKNRYNSLITLLYKLKEYIRKHYRKNQMLIFPYLERRGINAIPRVLWGKEDEIIVKLRKILTIKPERIEDYDKLAREVIELSNQALDLVFRENKILYPTIWILFEPGEWRVIHELAKELGYIVDIDKEWSTNAQPLYPYMIDGTIPPEKLEKLPIEVRNMLKNINPDKYEIKKPGDIEFKTGFLQPGEIEEILRSLPLELTYADKNDRVRFFTKSKLTGGFPRTKTIIGRRLEYCHPPRLEGYVKFNVKLLKEGKFPYREFWTRMGNRIIRVLVVGIRDNNGEYLGTLEIVEDFTDIIKNPEEIKKKIVVL